MRNESLFIIVGDYKKDEKIRRVSGRESRFIACDCLDFEKGSFDHIYQKPKTGIMIASSGRKHCV